MKWFKVDWQDAVCFQLIAAVKICHETKRIIIYYDTTKTDGIFEGVKTIPYKTKQQAETFVASMLANTNSDNVYTIERIQKELDNIYNREA